MQEKCILRLTFNRVSVNRFFEQSWAPVNLSLRALTHRESIVVREKYICESVTLRQPGQK